MNDKVDSSDASDFSGRMMLYESPELLSRQRHSALGLTRSTRDFRFSLDAASAPLAMTELVSAMKHYPVVFSGETMPDLAVVFGFPHRENLFVNSNGEWDRDAYIPAYLDCHPFALARSERNELALVIDRSSDLIGENPEIPFFDGEELSPEIRKRAKFCAQVDADRAMTQKFCQCVKDLDLLSTQAAFYDRDGSDEKEQALAEYLAVDASKLATLDKEQVYELHTNGYLSYIYAHLYSLDNWARIADRLYR